MATTALDLIKGAMRPLNVLTGNTALTASESADALQALNWMLESWANSNLTLFHTVRERFTLPSGVNPVTYGPLGNLDAVRPVAIKQAVVTIVTVDYPVQILGYDDYEAIRLKTLQTAWPTYLYYEPDYPLGKVFTWPVNSGNVMTFGVEKPLQGFATLYDVVSLPPGYADAIRFNLALRLAPEYQITAGPDLMQLAERALKAIKHTNGRIPPTVQSDPMLGTTNQKGGYIIYSDGYR